MRRLTEETILRVEWDNGLTTWHRVYTTINGKRIYHRGDNEIRREKNAKDKQ